MSAMAEKPYSTAERFPDFAEGWIVIDARDAPTLANAIGSRIYKTARGCSAAWARACRGRSDGKYIHAVPVNGPNGVFAIDYIFAGDVIVNKDGVIRMAR